MSSRRNLNFYLLKANRILVWVLLFLLVLFVISGYGLLKPSLIRSLTGGRIDYQTSLFIHTTLDAPLLVFLLVHVIIEIKFLLMRWGVKNEKALNITLMTLGLICLILIIYAKLAETEWWHLG